VEQQIKKNIKTVVSFGNYVSSVIFSRNFLQNEGHDHDKLATTQVLKGLKGLSHQIINAWQ
jgi:bacterioferritin (cytochrome b1)